MPTIDFSPGMASGISTRMLRLGENLSSTNNVAVSGLTIGSGIGNGAAGAMGLLLLMKGTRPLPTDQTTIDALAADVLVRFVSNSSPVGGDFQTTQQGPNPAIISTSYKNAEASGVATWFWWVVAQGQSGAPSYSTSLPLHQQIIGSVGTTGSGADLEIPNTTITASEAYRVMNLRLQFPTSWIY